MADVPARYYVEDANGDLFDDSYSTEWEATNALRIAMSANIPTVVGARVVMRYGDPWPAITILRGGLDAVTEHLWNLQRNGDVILALREDGQVGVYAL